VIHLECRDLLRRRRQAEQIEGRTPDERARVGGGREGQAGGTLLVEERVDGVAGKLSAEGRRLPERLVGPEVLRFVAALRPVVGEAAAGRDDDAILGGPFLGVGGSDLLLFRGLGPRGAGGDPLLYPTDLFGREPVVLLRRNKSVG
jgi:hypothetical protein